MTKKDVTKQLYEALRDIQALCGGHDHFGGGTFEKMNEALKAYEKWNNP